MTKIILIDDSLSMTDPLLLELKEQYDAENVKLFNNAKQGREYILNHLNDKTILLLDWDLRDKQITGFSLFKEIVAKTSLIYIIMMSANLSHKLSKGLSRKDLPIEPEHLIELINHHAMRFTDSNIMAETFLKIIADAEAELSVRLDCVLQEWILNHPDDTFNNPYMMTKAGKTYTLRDILEGIRQGTELGLDLQRKILLTAIDFLTRNKRKLDD